jgi:hypothetical protein
MATFVTDSAIEHDGKRTEEGVTVKKSDFPADAWDALVEAGAVKEVAKDSPADEKKDAENDALKARVAELEAELKEARKPPTPQTTPAPAGDKK